MQDTSNIMAYNICKGRNFEEINQGTAWHSITVQQEGGGGGGEGVSKEICGSVRLPV